MLTMKYIDVLKYCLSLPDTRKESEVGQGQRFTLLRQDQPFAFFETGAPIQWQFVIRVSADQYESFYNPPQVRKTDRKPGFWIVITRVENFDGELLKDLIQWSYQQAALVKTV